MILMLVIFIFPFISPFSNEFQRSNLRNKGKAKFANFDYITLTDDKHFKSIHSSLSKNLNSNLHFTKQILSGCKKPNCNLNEIESQYITNLNEEDIEEYDYITSAKNEIEDDFNKFCNELSNYTQFYPDISYFGELKRCFQISNQNLTFLNRSYEELIIKFEKETLEMNSIEFGQKEQSELRIYNASPMREPNILQVKSSYRFLNIYFNQPGKMGLDLPSVTSSGLNLLFSYYPLFVGKHTMFVLFVFENNTHIVYKVTASIIQNSLNIRPIINTNILFNTVSFIPIKIENHLPTSLEIKCITISSSPFISLVSKNLKEYTCNQILIINSKEISQIGILFNTSQALKYDGFINITMNYEINYTFPVILESKKSNNPFHEIINIGTFRRNNLPRRVEIKYLGKTSIDIKSLKVPITDNFQFDFLSLSKYKTQFQINETQNLLGYATFYDETPGEYETTFYIKYQNSSSEIKLKANVIEEENIKYIYSDYENIEGGQLNISDLFFLKKQNSFSMADNSIYSNEDLIPDIIEEPRTITLKKNKYTYNSKLYESIYIVKNELHSFPIKMVYPDLVCKYFTRNENGEQRLVNGNCNTLSEINIGYIGTIYNTPAIYEFELMIYYGSNIPNYQLIINILNEKNENLFIHSCDRMNNSIFMSKSMNFAFKEFEQKSIKICIKFNENVKSKKTQKFKLEWETNKQKWNSDVEMNFIGVDWEFKMKKGKVKTFLTKGIQSYGIEFYSYNQNFPIEILKSEATSKLISFKESKDCLPKKCKYIKEIIQINPLNLMDKFIWDFQDDSKTPISLKDILIMENYNNSWNSLIKNNDELVRETLTFETNFIQKVTIPFEFELIFPRILPNNEEVILENIKIYTQSQWDLNYKNENKLPIEMQFFLFSRSPQELKEELYGNYYSSYCLKSKIRDSEVEFCCNLIEISSQIQDLIKTKKYEFNNNQTIQKNCLQINILDFIFNENKDKIIKPKGSKDLSQQFDSLINNNYFYINRKYNSSLIVQAKEIINLTLVRYSPQEEGVHEAYVYIKNNLSILEVFKLKAFGVKGKLEIINIPEKEEYFYHKSIETNINGAEINLILDESVLTSKYKENYDMLNDKLRTFMNEILSLFGKNLSIEITKFFYKSFLLKNFGNTSIKIIDSFFGNSRGPFYTDDIYMNLPYTLIPNKSIKMTIKLENDLSLIKSRRPIIFYTDTGIHEFYLITNIEKYALNHIYRKNFLDLYDLKIQFFVLFFALGFTLLIIYDLIISIYEQITDKRMFKQKILKAKKDKLNLSQRPSNLNKFLDSILLKNLKETQGSKIYKNSAKVSSKNYTKNISSSYDVIQMIKKISLTKGNPSEEVQPLEPISKDLLKENNENLALHKVDGIKERNKEEARINETILKNDETKNKLSIPEKLNFTKKEDMKSNNRKSKESLQSNEEISIENANIKGANKGKFFISEKDNSEKMYMTLEHTKIDKFISEKEEETNLNDQKNQKDQKEVKDLKDLKYQNDQCDSKRGYAETTNNSNEKNIEGANEQKEKTNPETEDIFENEKKACKKQIFYIPYKGRTSYRQKYHYYKEAKPNLIFVKKENNQVEEGRVNSQEQEQEEVVKDDILPRGIQELLQDEEEKTSDQANGKYEKSESHPTESMNIPYNFLNLQDEVDKNELDIFLKFHENFDEKKFCSIKKFWENESNTNPEIDQSPISPKSEIKDLNSSIYRTKILQKIEKELELDYSPYDPTNIYPQIPQQLEEGADRYPDFLRKTYKL